MKKAGFLLALICILSLTGCGMVASAEEEMLQPNMEENVVLVNFDDVATQSEPTEQYCDYLAQTTENMFADEDGIESAAGFLLINPSCPVRRSIRQTFGESPGIPRHCLRCYS